MKARTTTRLQLQQLMSGESLAVGVVAAGHFVLCCFLSYAVSLGVDEAYTLASTAHGPVHAFRQALHFALQPPVYFVLASLWRVGGDSVFVLRLFSALCTTATILLLPAIARGYLSEVNWRWLTVAVAVNPLTVYAGIEARCYGLVLLLSAVLLLSFQRAYVSLESARRRRWSFAALHLLCALAGLLTFYPLGFLLAAQGGTLVALRRWRDSVRYAMSMAVAGLCALPLLLSVPDQLGSHTAQTTIASPPFADAARLVAWIARDLVLPLGWEIGEALAPALWLTFLTAVVVALIRRREYLWAPGSLLVGMLTVVTFTLLVFLARLTGTELFGPRYAVPLLLPLLLFCSHLANVSFGRRGPIVLCCLAIAFSGPSLQARYELLAKGGDWRRAAAFVMHHEARGEDVVVFRPPAALGFGYYYRGDNSIVPLPCEERCEAYDVSRFVLHSTADVATHLSTLSRHDAFWLVTENQSAARRQRFGFDHLEDWLAANCQLTVDARFHGSRVRQFEWKLTGQNSLLPSSPTFTDLNSNAVANAHVLQD